MGILLSTARSSSTAEPSLAEELRTLIANQDLHNRRIAAMLTRTTTYDANPEYAGVKSKLVVALNTCVEAAERYRHVDTTSTTAVADAITQIRAAHRNLLDAESDRLRVYNTIDAEARAQAEAQARAIPASTHQIVTVDRAYTRRLEEESTAFRVPGVTGGLLSPEKAMALYHGVEFEYTVPNAGYVPYADRVDRIINSLQLKHRLDRLMPELTHFDFRKHGVVLAGGSVAYAAAYNGVPAPWENSFDDFDLFLVGHADDAARLAAVNAVGAYLAGTTRGPLTVQRTVSAVTFLAGGRKYQVILRGYATMAEVLHGFDIGACAIGFDGRDVRMTALGAFALYARAFPLTLAGRRASYEHRLIKYTGRKYRLLMPGLDASKLRAVDGVLPYVRISVRASPADNQPLGWVYPAPTASVRAVVFGATYEDQVRQFFRRTSTVQSNFKALASTPVNVAALVAEAVWTPDLDIPGMKVDVASALSAAEASVCAKWQPAMAVFENKFVNRLVGPDVAAAVAGLDYAAMREQALARLADLRATADTVATIPFGFRGVDEDTLLTRATSANAVTEAEWYGAAYLTE